MGKRKYEPGAFVPCSPKHKSCSPAHAQLVRGYREERERQETKNEMILTNGAEKELWKANGNSLITFKTWLKANKRSEKIDLTTCSDTTTLTMKETNTQDRITESTTIRNGYSVESKRMVASTLSNFSQQTRRKENESFL